jgi:hypothetical protein
MIVSYSRNFIFIKTRKTAGSTVEAVLAGGCGPYDIIAKTEGETYPGSGIPIRGRMGTGDGKPPRPGRKKSGDFYNHMTAAELRPKLDPAFWSAALKLTVERHPYEKAVSQAFFRLGKSNRRQEEFPAFLDRIVRAGKYAGFAMWSIDGKVAVDEFIRQETLDADLRRVGARLGIEVPAELPTMKSRTRSDARPAREILSDEQKQFIFETCREEFEILGYER